MALTGKKRSLTVRITNTLAGEMVAGYPKTYMGMQAFTQAGVTYPTIDQDMLATMPIERYEARLAAFKAHVEAQEVGLNLAQDQTNSAYYGLSSN